MRKNAGNRRPPTKADRERELHIGRKTHYRYKQEGQYRKEGIFEQQKANSFKPVAHKRKPNASILKEAGIISLMGHSIKTIALNQPSEFCSHSALNEYYCITDGMVDASFRTFSNNSSI